MVSSGLSDQLVMSSIRRSGNTDFDVTPQGLIALKKADVSEAIISLMLDPPGPAQEIGSASRTPPSSDLPSRGAVSNAGAAASPVPLEPRKGR